MTPSHSSNPMVPLVPEADGGIYEAYEKCRRCNGKGYRPSNGSPFRFRKHPCPTCYMVIDGIVYKGREIRKLKGTIDLRHRFIRDTRKRWNELSATTDGGYPLDEIGFVVVVVVAGFFRGTLPLEVAANIKEVEE